MEMSDRNCLAKEMLNDIYCNDGLSEYEKVGPHQDPVDNTTYEDIVEAKNVTPKEDVYYSLAAAVPQENEKRKAFLVKLFLLLLYILLFDTITFLTIYYVTDLKEEGHIEELNGKYAAFHEQLDHFKKELLSMSEENDYLQGNLSEIQYQYKEMSKNLNEMTKINAILNRFCPGSNTLTQGKRCTVCPEGWLLFNLKCYFFSADTMNWSSSRDMCNSFGGRLVIIRSKEEQEFLLKTMSNKEEADKSYWIGLTDQVTEGQFIWVDGTPVAQHEGWDELWGIRTDGRREPDNWVDDSSVIGEDCVYICKIGGYQGWYDAACQQKYKRICEAPAALVLTSPVSETQSGV
ncbi:low affinity immunoglobulin epsilon Fc receptor-like [Polypterus senegalus]|uniref:low affinity immunoglobulin epsilon Fc receptor-like n=1 Tax=Polypterus senegalus TaxID=55291 RepID=UPI0019625F08|nr:low affinity immunoglobulin epsilon Fc receptor-like [Polypterus senegalus]